MKAISYKKIYNFTVLCLFVAFLGFYISAINDGGNNINKKKTYLTKESIKRFEDDVEKGKEIKVENYVVNMQKNYDNKLSRFGRYTSKFMGNTFKWGMTKTFKVIDKMMEDE